ncbi:unnamed protein product [Acanthoscelides obtectus]|uniref:Lymphocyte expansion molecule-like n=1 Tax=Acanthoscelides obtectus TaxID=200917 RepID=A0A9P0PYZ3_ACAOB|nr:unnamed protein product [Acanthoscelides obtectus]CAK1651533.1 Lymphocyte expansion molecule [Acanthoscelides obtectus]
MGKPDDKPFKTYAPFGIATKRFVKVGFHPSLDKSGAMKKLITKVGPGSYNPRKPTCSKHECSWKTKVESEAYSKFLGFRNAHLLKEREFYETLRGPGTNDTNEALFKQQRSSVLDNVGLGAGKRFTYLKGFDENIPPPNSYFRDLSRTSTVKKKRFSNTPIFEWDGIQDRFKSRAPRYHLAANRYKINDGKNIASIIDKICSIRGPYDLFTGPRDETTIRNDFGTSGFTPPEFWYIKPSSLNFLLNHPSKTKSGKFLHNVRFPRKPTARSMLNDLSLCYRDPEDPGPAHYEDKVWRISNPPSATTGATSKIV